MYAAGATIRTMDKDEMQELFGGMDMLAPTRDSGALYDFFWLVGRTAAGVVNLITADRPPSPYTYAKVGYTS